MYFRKTPAYILDTKQVCVLRELGLSTTEEIQKLKVNMKIMAMDFGGILMTIFRRVNGIISNVILSKKRRMNFREGFPAENYICLQVWQVDFKTI